jgi:Ca-activated chloride channel homolog
VQTTEERPIVVATPPAPDPEALFAEARRHRRQRRLRLVAILVALLGLAGGIYVALGDGATRNGVSPGGGAAGAAPVKTVVLLVDVSGSMRSSDVRPTRLEAAVAAMRSFADRLPDGVEVGVVSFSSTAQVVQAPTRDRARLRAALRTLEPQAGTALGDGLARATRLAARTLERDGVGRDAAGFLPAAIVLESDGAQNRGRVMPLAAARAAKAAGIRVYGVALGKPDGTVEFGFGLSVNAIPVPPDARTVAAVAHATGGSSYVAEDAARLAAAYRRIADRLT